MERAVPADRARADRRCRARRGRLSATGCAGQSASRAGHRRCLVGCGDRGVPDHRARRQRLQQWALAGAAFVFGLFTTAAVYLLSLRDGASSTIMLVLTGIAVNAFATGIIAYLTFVANPNDREQIVFWQLGSVAGASWNQVWVAAPLIVAGCAGALALSHKLDLLALGDVQAASLGVNVEVVRRQAIVLVAILTAAAVAFAGIIMFVGLIVPHVMRLVLAPVTPPCCRRA